MRTSVVWCGLFVIGCSGATPPEPSPAGKADPPKVASAVPEAPVTAAPTQAGSQASPRPATTGAPAATPVAASAPAPGGGMRRAEAEKYVLGLINRDRAAHG